MIECLHGAATQPEKVGIFVPASVWMNLTELKDVRHERGHIYMSLKREKFIKVIEAMIMGTIFPGGVRGGAAAREPS